MTVKPIRGRGIVGKPRRGQPVPMCWYCGGYTGELATQPDGTLLHDFCEELAERDYPRRVACDGERVDAKVAWLDVRGVEDDARADWAHKYRGE